MSRPRKPLLPVSAALILLMRAINPNYAFGDTDLFVIADAPDNVRGKTRILRR